MQPHPIHAQLPLPARTARGTCQCPDRQHRWYIVCLHQDWAAPAGRPNGRHAHMDICTREVPCTPVHTRSRIHTRLRVLTAFARGQARMRAREHTRTCARLHAMYEGYKKTLHTTEQKHLLEPQPKRLCVCWCAHARTWDCARVQPRTSESMKQMTCDSAVLCCF